MGVSCSQLHRISLRLRNVVTHHDIDENTQEALMLGLNEEIENLKATALITKNQSGSEILKVIEILIQKVNDIETFQRRHQNRTRQLTGIVENLTSFAGKYVPKIEKLQFRYQEFALRQAVNQFFVKCLCEIGGDEYRDMNRNYAPNSFKNFLSLPDPYARRWRNLRSHLEITITEKVLDNYFYRLGIDPNNASHQNFTQSYDELVAIADSFEDEDQTYFAKTLLELNLKMQKERLGDTLYTTKTQNSCILKSLSLL